MIKKIIIAGRSNFDLAKKISKTSKIPLANVEINNFSDGELNIWIKNDLKNHEVFIIQSTNYPANDNLMELFLLCDATRRLQPQKITVVLPYFGYSRKEKMSRPGEPISAKVIVDILENLKVNQIITLDLHSPVIQGFSNIPFTNLSPLNLFLKEIKKNKIKNMVILSPDIGATKKARDLAQLLRVPLAIIEKERFITQKDKVNCFNLIGSVKNKNVVIIDDIISTGSTILQAVNLIKKEGAKKIFIVASHLTAVEKMKEKFDIAEIEKIITTDSIWFNQKNLFKKIKIISIDQLIAQNLN